MSTSDWDESSDESEAPPAAPVAAAKKSKWADEDAEDDDPKDSWDASDDESESKPATTNGTAKAPPVRRKGITKQKIAEREAEEEAKRQEIERRRAEENDPAARRRRELAQQVNADMEAAKSLFGGMAISSTDPLSMNPKTAEDWDALSSQLAEILVSKHGSKPLYTHFLEDFTKRLCEPLKDVETRKISSGLTTLANEKQAASKAKVGGKKTKGSTKPIANVKSASKADTTPYREMLDDGGEYDDFM